MRTHYEKYETIFVRGTIWSFIARFVYIEKTKQKNQMTTGMKRGMFAGSASICADDLYGWVDSGGIYILGTLFRSEYNTNLLKCRHVHTQDTRPNPLYGSS